MRGSQMTAGERRHHSSHREELRYIQQASGMVANEGIRLRLQNLLFWFVQEARRARIKYYMFTIITVILSTAVMIITSASTGLAIWASEAWGTAANLLVAVLAGCTNIVSSLLALTKWRENWIRHRRCADQIEGELSLYLAQAKPYQNPDYRDGKLMTRVERIAVCEEKSWAETMLSETEQVPSSLDAGKPMKIQNER